MADLFGKILSLCKRRGFIIELKQRQGRYVCGPLGNELKRNIVNEWWHAVVTSSSNVHGINLKTFLPPQQKSVNGAVVDTIDTSLDGQDEMMSYMFETTAKCLDLKPPFGIAQVGQAHTEVHSSTQLSSKSPDDESLSVQFLCSPVEERKWFSHWPKNRLRWWRKFSRNPEQFSLGEGGAPKQLCSVQYAFPWGDEDVESIKNKGSSEWTLMMSDNLSLVSMVAGVNRAMWAYLCDAYTEVERPQVAAHTMLKLHVSLAPYKVAILPADGDNTKLCMYCRVLCEELKHAGISTTYCNTGALSHRLTLQDELGTPYRVIAGAGTLESGIVTLQDRDTTGEEDMNGKDVLLSLQRMLFGARIN